VRKMATTESGSSTVESKRLALFPAIAFLFLLFLGLIYLDVMPSLEEEVPLDTWYNIGIGLFMVLLIGIILTAPTRVETPKKATGKQKIEDVAIKPVSSESVVVEEFKEEKTEELKEGLLLGEIVTDRKTSLPSEVVYPTRMDGGMVFDTYVPLGQGAVLKLRSPLVNISEMKQK